MTTSIKPLYAGITPITIPAGLNGLVNGAAVATALLDNSVDLLFDIGIEFAIQLAAGAFSGQSRINFYAVGGDGGGLYSGNYSAAGAFTLENPNDFAILGYRSVGGVLVPVSGIAQGFIPSLAAYFNGTIPKKWALIIENQTGLAFAGAGHTLQYGGVQAQGIG